MEDYNVENCSKLMEPNYYNESIPFVYDTHIKCNMPESVLSVAILILCCAISRVTKLKIQISKIF